LSLRVTLFTLLALVAAAALVFQLFQRQLSGAWFAFGVHPDVLALIDRSLEDQKRLARADPQHAAAYRRRFEEVRALQTHFKVLAYNRQEIVERYEQTLLAVVSGIVILAGSGYALRQVRQEGRLARLQRALADLSAGWTDIRVGERRRDVIGRIAAMVEQTSRVMARDRRRLASLENLSAWQEAARRHAHEMRTPLTAAKLELIRMRSLLEAGDEPEVGLVTNHAELVHLQESVTQEIDSLGRFTHGFTSFARLPRPTLARRDLGGLVGELADLFAAAWPELTLRYVPAERPVEVLVDPEMLRQVLVNLCDNSALALRERGRGAGRVTFTLAALEGTRFVALHAADDGPGVPPEIRGRLFEPYTTSRRVGEGMGLGLAISRKILLDHGGDLELVRTSEAGTVFRLLFPEVSPEVSSEVSPEVGA
jgi:two-component system, NtrC family, nitrogen regulation sensor histidine kinase NtrY